jgi:hypothetical protein
MPVYIYICDNRHEQTVVEPMVTAAVHYCPTCSRLMHRKPQAFAVNWGGISPSQGEWSPVQREMIENAPRRRAELQEKHK